MEEVENFKYLGRPLYQTDDYWPAVRRNAKRVQRLLGRLGGFAKKGRGGPQSVRHVLQGGDIGGTSLWLGQLGNIGGNGEDGGGDAHRVSDTNHGE